MLVTRLYCAVSEPWTWASLIYSNVVTVLCSEMADIGVCYGIEVELLASKHREDDIQ